VLVILPQPAGLGAGVTLTSSNPAIVPVPPFESILPGMSVIAIPINTLPVSATTPVTITVSSLGGSVTATLIVAPPLAPLSRAGE
jgi:hypothetical protein